MSGPARQMGSAATLRTPGPTTLGVDCRDGSPKNDAFKQMFQRKAAQHRRLASQEGRHRAFPAVETTTGMHENENGWREFHRLPAPRSGSTGLPAWGARSLDWLFKKRKRCN
jgi:hypothetical protein